MAKMQLTTCCAVFGMSSMLHADFLITVVDCIPSAPADSALGDINGDGMLDLVASLEDRILVQLNGGEAPDASWPGFMDETIEWRMKGTSPGIDIGDATGDGALDVLVALPGENAIGILVNAGGRIPLLSPIHIPITDPGEGSPLDVSLADYSASTEPVIAIATERSGALTYRPTPSGITPGDIDAIEEWTVDRMQEELAGLPLVPRSTPPRGVKPGDIDPGGGKDEDVDLRATSTMYIKQPNMIEACMLDESEEGYRLQSWNVGIDPIDFALADLDRNGSSDLITANAGDDTISILLANEEEGFLMADIIDLPATPRSLCAGDFDGDGDADLAVAVDKEGATVLFLRNESEIPGELDLHIDPVQHEIESVFFDLLPGDVDGDGIVNAVVLASPSPRAPRRSTDPDGDGVTGPGDLVLLLEEGHCSNSTLRAEPRGLEKIIALVAALQEGSNP